MKRVEDEKRTKGDDFDPGKPRHLPCYVSSTTPRGCSASHLMHPELDAWYSLYSLVGPETSIAVALPLLDRAGATEQDYDVLLCIRSWITEVQEEKRKAEASKPG